MALTFLYLLLLLCCWLACLLAAADAVPNGLPSAGGAAQDAGSRKRKGCVLLLCTVQCVCFQINAAEDLLQYMQQHCIASCLFVCVFSCLKASGAQVDLI
jgi:hypothetical protein